MGIAESKAQIPPPLPREDLKKILKLEKLHLVVNSIAFCASCVLFLLFATYFQVLPASIMSFIAGNYF